MANYTYPVKFVSWKDAPKTDWRWPNFSPSELASKREGELLVDPKSLDALQKLRNMLGKPILITSAYRSAKHNAAVGGAPNSYHMKGMAFDCRMENQDPEEFVRLAKACGFNGIGYYPEQNFIHIDTRATPTTWGTPFKKGPTDTPVEPKKSTTAEKIAAVGGGGTVVAGLSSVGSLHPTAQIIVVVVMAAVLVSIAYLLRKRIAALLSGD